jgi:mercuric ion transport protein
VTAGHHEAEAPGNEGRDGPPEVLIVIRSIARQAHPIVGAVFIACVFLQVFLAGLGVFDDPRAFITHRDFGYTFGILTLVLLVLALVGRGPRRIAGLSGLLLLLFAFQSVFIALRESQPTLAALHPVNGFLILLVAIVVTRASWAVRAAPTTDAPATGTVQPTPSGAR